MASIFGLIYSCGFSLPQTVALVRGSWPGRYEWCVTANVMSYYIVYGLVYSTTLVTLEVSKSRSLSLFILHVQSFNNYIIKLESEL